MSELATTEQPAHGSALTLSTGQEFWNDHQVAALRQMGLEKAGNGDLAVFLHVAQRTGLDPFAKQIYMIGRWSKDGTKYTIQTGIDGFRLIARRASDRLAETLEYEDTQWCGRDGEWTDVWASPTAPPMGAKVTVLRHGKRFPAVATYGEYAQTVKDGGPNSMWARMPANQLAKCAEAQALRKAFPLDLSGIYSDDEMDQAERPARRESPNQGSAADRMSAALAPQPSNPDPSPDETPEAITPAQIKRMAAQMGELSLTQRDDALAYVADVIGHPVGSRNDLSKVEASKVIDALQADLTPAQGEITAEDAFEATP